MTDVKFALKGTPLPPIEPKDAVLLPSGVAELKAPSIWASRIDGHLWQLTGITNNRAQMIGPALVDVGEWGGMILTMPVATLALQYEWQSDDMLWPWQR